jgi:hypothetical protein
MKNKRNILGGSLLVILVTFILVALIFALQTQAQEISLGDDNNSPTGASIKTELTTGSWVMTDVKTHQYNRGYITKWESTSNEITGLCSWKDILDIVHTVSSGFKWDPPPQTMRPGTFLNIDAKYINNEYSTTAKMLTGIKMSIDKVGSSYMANSPDAIEVMKVSKDNKQYSSEDKKGFFNAPKTLFDDTNQCQLIIDCYIGQDHYVTTYTYTYQP